MAQVEVNIAISRLVGAFRYTISGKTAKKECICIPIDKLTEDKNNCLWASFRGYDDTKFDRMTHSLKQSVSKAVYNSLPTDTTGAKVKIPYSGSIRLAKGQSADNKEGQQAPAHEDDLPF